MATPADQPVPSAGLPSDLAIARAAELAPLDEVAARAGIPADLLEPYGPGVAKIPLRAIEALADRPRARYVVVTAITPTPLGEGKTTTTVGLGQGFARIGRRATITLRQPSMGPTFGLKGGAAGGGYSQVVPMERLNLHLTGDTHAVTAAHNLCAALIDAHLFHQRTGAGAAGGGVAGGGVAPDLDPAGVTWRRVLDVNDRALRNVVVGLGGRLDGVPRETGFDITAASEVMAALSLATSLADLRARMGRIVIGSTRSGEPVTADDIGAAGAMTVILRDALQPNLLQTLEHTPALVHTGPFGNIATGCSSVVADLIGIRTGDYLLTEAGFGADMGAERFFNIKCRVSGLVPEAAVVVATVRGLKAHSGRYRIVAGRPLPEGLAAPNPDEVHEGGANLERQIANVRRHGVTPVVAINVFPGDHPADLAAIAAIAERCGARWARATHVADGGRGAAELAEAVADACDAGPGSSGPEGAAGFRFLYPDEAPLTDKIAAIATGIYGADGVSYTPAAEAQLATYERAGWGRLPICMAKTHLSLTADPTRPGAPTGWTLPVREVRASVGAGFIYPICGDMRTMPGLGSHPAAHHIDLDFSTDPGGTIVGLS